MEGKGTGNKQERTEWHRVVFFGRLAEIAGEYLRKGSKVYVEGSLRTRDWEDKDGNKRYTTEIVGREMQMLDTANNGAKQQAPQSRAAPKAPAGGGFPDDDIPFAPLEKGGWA